MTKYFLFAGQLYYPEGGAWDFRGAFDTADEAKAAFANERDCDWAQIAVWDGESLTPLYKYGAYPADDWVKGQKYIYRWVDADFRL